LFFSVSLELIKLSPSQYICTFSQLLYGLKETIAHSSLICEDLEFLRIENGVVDMPDKSREDIIPTYVTIKMGSILLELFSTKHCFSWCLKQQRRKGWLNQQPEHL
jgi:hypothetical protein